MFKGRQKVLFCYLILLVWIFLIIAGTYKYMSLENTHPVQNFILEESNDDFIETKQIKHIFESCTELDDVVAKDEGGVYEDFVLKGIIVLTRHGDRGPLNYVNGIDSIDCGAKNDMLTTYVQFITNWTRALWPQVDPFHGFQLLPLSSTSCQLGQLTYKGVAQLLKLGKVLHDVYAKHLFASASTNELTFLLSDILIVSTKYRRTFQSAMALMFNMVPSHVWTHLSIKESFSISFCFTDCACASTNYYQKLLTTELENKIHNQPHIEEIIKNLRNSLIDSKDAHVPDLIDALLSFLCHKAALPCKNYSQNSWNSLKMSYRRSLQEMDSKFSNYIINIDQDDKSKDVTAYDDLIDIYNNKYEDDKLKKCITSEHVTILFNYLYKNKKRQLQSVNNNIISILKAYGLIKNIVKKMLGIVSNNKPKFILYSGHDKTLQYLTTALGFGDIFSIPYASRVIFEIYLRKQVDNNNYPNVLAKEYYFRVLFNGKDVTKKLIFCRGNKSMTSTRKDFKGQVQQSYFCPIEYIVRYIHEDYFVSLNSTNYKDACTKHS